MTSMNHPHPPTIKSIAYLAGVTPTQVGRHYRGEQNSAPVCVATIALSQKCADNSANSLLADLTEGASASLIKSFARIHSTDTMDAKELLDFFTLAIDSGVQVQNLRLHEGGFIFEVCGSSCKLSHVSEKMVLSINGVRFIAVGKTQLHDILISHSLISHTK